MLSRHRGQAMIETALVLPLLFFIIFGTIEGGLRVVANQSAQYAVQRAADIIAAAGRVPDADVQGLRELRKSVLGQTNLDEVTWVEVEQVQDNGASLTPRRGNRYRWSSPDPAGLPAQCMSLDEPPSPEAILAPSGPNWPPCSRVETPGSTEYVRVSVFFSYPFRDGILRGTPLTPERATAVARVDPVFFRPVAQPPPPEEDIIENPDLRVSYWDVNAGSINAGWYGAGNPYLIHGLNGAGCADQPNRQLRASVTFQGLRYGPGETLFRVGWLTDLNQGQAAFLPDPRQPPPVMEANGAPFSVRIDDFPGYAEPRGAGSQSGWFQPQVVWDDALGHHVQPSPPLSPPPGSRLYWKCVP